MLRVLETESVKKGVPQPFIAPAKPTTPAACSTEAADTKTPLSQDEKLNLSTCEGEIKLCLNAPLKLGAQLNIIKSKDLFRSEFATYEEYCKKRWDISRVHANRLIEWHLCVKNIMSAPKGAGVYIPTSENHIRSLTNIPAPGQIKIAEAVKSAVGDKKATAKDWQKAKEELFPSTKPANADEERPKMIFKRHPTATFVKLKNILEMAQGLVEQGSPIAEIEKELKEALEIIEHYVEIECGPAEKY